MKPKGNVLLLSENQHQNVASTSIQINLNTTNVSTSAATMNVVGLAASTSSLSTNAMSDLKQSICNTSTTTPTSTSASSSNNEQSLEENIFQLMMLIIEGRIPDSDSKRGYKEGFHVNIKKSNHQCSIKITECHIAYQIKSKISKWVENNTILNVKNLHSVPTPPLITNINSTGVTNQTASTNIQQQPLKSPIISAINRTKRNQSVSPSPSPSRSSSSSSINSNTNLSTPINIILDVCLVADCCHDIIKGDLIKSKSSVSYELLERWNISIMPNKKSDSKLTFNELFLAIRSYLHFSQISSWLNQNKGQSPTTVAYSIYCSQDTNRFLFNNNNNNTNDIKNVLSNSITLPSSSSSTTSTTTATSDYFDDEDKTNLINNFDTQTFPLINIICGTNNLYNLTVNLQYRKRKNTLTLPYIYCNKLNKCCNYKNGIIKRLSFSDNNDEQLNNNDNIDTPTTANIIMHKDNNNFLFNFSTSTPITSAAANLFSTTTAAAATTTTTDTSNNRRRSSMEMSPDNGEDCDFKNLIKNSNNYSYNYNTKSTLLKTPISPSPGERRRLSLDTLEFDSNRRQPKCLKCIDTTINDNIAGAFNNNNNNSDDDSGISNCYSSSSHSSRSSYSNNNSSSINNKRFNLPQKPNLSMNEIENQTKIITNNNNTSELNSLTSASASTSPPTSNTLVSFSPSSPIIVLSNLSDLFKAECFRNKNNNENSKVLSELCTSTQNQLNLIDNQENSESTKNNSSSSISILTSTPSICNNNSNNLMQIQNGENDNKETNKNDNHLVNSKTCFDCNFDNQNKNGNSNKAFFYLNNDDDDDDDDVVVSKLDEKIIKDEDEDEDDLLCIKNKNRLEKPIEQLVTISKHDAFTPASTSISSDQQQQQQQQQQKQLIHFIRSPTDGVCLPIFKTQDCNNNETANVNFVSTDATLLNEKTGKRNQRSINTFHNKTGLPLSSSPAPMRKSGSAFTFDKSLRNPKSIKNALSLSLLKSNVDDEEEDQANKPFYFNSRTFNQTTSSLRLLGTFEESLLNGRMNPMGIVEGFYAEIGASGSFFPEHVTLPVHAAFYHVCDDIAASPYLGVINLSAIGRRGYKVPNKGTIQVTLFNPNNTVVKMFVVMYDLSDMPANHRTFLRQRTMYVPLPSLDCADDSCCNEQSDLKSYLRYSIHLRFATSKSGKLYLHTNIKLIFARNKCEIDPRLAKYEYKTFTEAPKAPRYSSKVKM